MIATDVELEKLKARVKLLETWAADHFERAHGASAQPAQGTQPPARNVEGLARVLAEADGADWENLNDETRETYRIMASAAIAFLDGGPTE